MLVVIDSTIMPGPKNRIINIDRHNPIVELIVLALATKITNSKPAIEYVLSCLNRCRKRPPKINNGDVKNRDKPHRDATTVLDTLSSRIM